MNGVSRAIPSWQDYLGVDVEMRGARVDDVDTVFPNEGIWRWGPYDISVWHVRGYHETYAVCKIVERHKEEEPSMSPREFSLISMQGAGLYRSEFAPQKWAPLYYDA